MDDFDFIQFSEIYKQNNPEITDSKIVDSEFYVYQHLSKKNIPYFFNEIDFLKKIGISKKYLNFILYFKNKAYKSFSIPKKNGKSRNISAPILSLKKLQRWILDNILYKVHISEKSHGFYPNRSIATNASYHIQQIIILNIDLKEYFPSIVFPRVFGFFKAIGYNNKIAFFLTHICTYNDQLPQGAPTSPMIANIISWQLDSRIDDFCKKKRFIIHKIRR